LRSSGGSRRATSSLVAAALAGLGGLSLATAPAVQAVQADSNTLYVAQGGTNSGNDCQTKATPCATITYAITVAGSAPTINLSGTIVDHLAPDRAITITGLGAASPAVIDGNFTGRVIDSRFSLTLRGLTITHGDATGSQGGGLVIDGPSVLLDRVLVTDNRAGTRGGGIYSNSDLTVIDSVFSNNVAAYPCIPDDCVNSQGGAINANFGSLTVMRSTFTGNTALGIGGRGGAISVRGDTVTDYTISSSTFTGNTAGSLGGGALEVPGVTGGAIRNSTFTGNSSAIQTVGSGTSTMTGTTITGNTGTGLAAYNAGGWQVAGSIISGNTGDDCNTDAEFYASGGYNVVGSGCEAAGTDTVSDTPNLAPLAGNGGPTQTRLPNAGSPAVGKVPVGTTAFGTTLCARKDQRGMPGPTAGQTRCASGAVEAGAGAAPVFTSAANTTVATLTTLNFTVNVNGATPTLAVSAATPLPAGVTFTDNRNGTAKIGGPAPVPGTYRFTITANNGIGGMVNQAFTLTVTKANQAVLALTSTGGTIGSPLPLTTSGGSGTGAVTYVVNAGGTATGCAIASGRLSITSATTGTCIVTATKATDPTYSAVSTSPTTVTFRQTQAALSLTSLNGTVGTPLTLTTSGGSGTGALSYTVGKGTAPGCSIASGKLSSTGAGTCIVTATKAQDGIWNARSSAPTNVNMRWPQTATLTVTSVGGVLGTPLALTSIGGNGTGAVTYTATNGTATGCSVASGKLNASTAGTCTVTATKAQDPNWNAKSSAPTAVLLKLPQAALRITSLTALDGTLLTLATAGGSGTGALTYSVSDGTATDCALVGAKVAAAASGTCIVTATKAGDATYAPTSSTPTTVTFQQLQAPLKLTSTAGVVGAPLTLTTSGGSGSGAVSYTASNGTASGCTIASLKLVATTAGTCIVTATKAAGGTYAAVSSSPTTVTLAKASQASLTVTSTSGTFGSQLTLTTSGGSGSGAVTFTAVNGTASACAIASGRLTSTSAGSCTVTATKAGDATYHPASSAATTVTFARVAQATLTVTSTSGSMSVPLTLTTSGGSGTGAVTYAVVNGTAGNCAVSVSPPYMLTAGLGTCLVTATKAADANYLVRSSAPTAVTFVAHIRARQAITFTSVVPRIARAGGRYTVAAKGGGSGLPVTFAVPAGSTICQVVGTQVSFLQPGACVIRASQAGNAGYLAAPQVQQSTTVTKALTRTRLAITRVKVRGVWMRRFAVRALPVTLGMATPTGKVVLKIGARKGCTIKLVRGTGTCRLAERRLPARRAIVKATYGGSSLYLTSYVKMRGRLR
jgi:predicted outer membrane repeat protein